jgi:hypothetical protein
MVDSAGRILGFRLRKDDGSKFSERGGREGLFIPDGIGAGVLMMCEGPTSCAALLDLGFDAIGRPSCTGGTALIIGLLRSAARRDVVVWGDNDTDKERGDGSTFRPGQEGARRLAAEILSHCRTVRVLIPPRHKDSRDWKNDGGTRSVIDAIIRCQPILRNIGLSPNRSSSLVGKNGGSGTSGYEPPGNYPPRSASDSLNGRTVPTHTRFP